MVGSQIQSIQQLKPIHIVSYFEIDPYTGKELFIILAFHQQPAVCISPESPHHLAFLVNTFQSSITCTTFSMVSCLPYYFSWNSRMQRTKELTKEFQELLMGFSSTAKVRKILPVGIFLLFPSQGTAAFFPSAGILPGKQSHLVKTDCQ